MKLKFSMLLVILVLLLGNFSMAKNATLNVGIDVGGDSQDVAVSQVEITPEKVGRAKSAFVQDKNVRWLSQSGQPDIPWKVMTVLLPPNAELSTVGAQLQAMYEDVDEIQDIDPVPPMATWIDGEQVIIWPAGKNIVDGYDVDIYDQDAFWPAIDTQIVTTAKKRQWKIAKIAVPMVRYNPVTDQIQVLVSAESNIDFAKLPKGQVKIKKKDRVGRPFIKKLAANFDTAIASYDAQVVKDSGQSLSDGEVAPASLSSTGYTIITTSAIQTASTKLANFVSHKQSLGFTVKVVTEGPSADSTHYLSGSTAADRATNMYNWLTSNYLADDTLYVLFVGDPRFNVFDTDTSVPMMSLSTTSDAATPTDWQYSDFGLDFNWEVIVGRIPYYDVISDTDHILQKTIDYENSTDTDWRRNVLLPMVPLDASTPAYQMGEQVKYYLLEPEVISSTRIYDENYGLNPPPEYLRANRYPATEWASGIYGMVVWDTHGWAGGASGIIALADVANLNDNYPGTTFQNSCENSWPEAVPSLTYSILKNGGIGNIGATRVSWYSVGRTDYTGTMAYQYAMHIVGKQTTGYGLVEARDAVYWHANAAVFNLYGDPSVTVIGDDPDFLVGPTHKLRFGNQLMDSGYGGEIDYTLYNNDTTSISWTASKTQSWLTLSPASGSIDASSSTVVTASLNSGITSLDVGTYTDTITFTDTTHSTVFERDVVVTVTRDVIEDFGGAYTDIRYTPGTSLDTGYTWSGYHYGWGMGMLTSGNDGMLDFSSVNIGYNNWNAWTEFNSCYVKDLASISFKWYTDSTSGNFNARAVIKDANGDWFVSDDAVPDTAGQTFTIDAATATWKILNSAPVINTPLSIGSAGIPDLTKVYGGGLQTVGLGYGGQTRLDSLTFSYRDTDPPTPNPAGFDSAPAALTDTDITMTATTGSDYHGPVEYYFDETSGNNGGTDSGWQTSPSYTDSDLDADTEYTYTVQMRDVVTPTPNVGTASSPASATTFEYAAIIEDFEYASDGLINFWGTGTLVSASTGYTWSATGGGWGVYIWEDSATNLDSLALNSYGFNVAGTAWATFDSDSVTNLASVRVVMDPASTHEGIGFRVLIQDASGDWFSADDSLSPASGAVTVDLASMAWNTIATPHVGYVYTETGTGTPDLSSVTGGGIHYWGTASTNAMFDSIEFFEDSPDAPDTDPPTPDPATWASAPAADSDTAISMTATIGIDATGPVEYYFDETSGNPGATDSEWQTSASYTDSGLTASTQYTYTVTMRDNLLNTGTASSPASATTDPAIDNYPPVWNSDPIFKTSAIEGMDYVEKLQTLTVNASDPDEGDVLTYSLVSAPSWLTVASDGQLSGTPADGDTGSNAFTVRVTDAGGLYEEATLNVYVAQRYTGELGLSDLTAFAARWLDTSCGSCGADLDGEGDNIDMQDWAIFAGHWLK